MTSYRMSSTAVNQNERPIIGVITQPAMLKHANGKTKIAASYVKFLEMAGARVVPIKLFQTVEEYETLINSINGVLMPGGEVSEGYSRTARIIFDLAVQANAKGDYFPVTGTCLGSQLMSQLVCGEKLQARSQTKDVALPLIFTQDAKDSKMFGNAPADIIDTLTQEPCTSHSHNFSLPLESYNNNELLHKFFSVLTINTDQDGDVVSTMEAREFPFYSTIWHPEKPMFEWTKAYVPQCISAVKVTHYMAHFFVSEARKNSHCFKDKEEERAALIYNYNPVYTGDTTVFEQMYFV